MFTVHAQEPPHRLDTQGSNKQHAGGCALHYHEKCHSGRQLDAHNSGVVHL